MQQFDVAVTKINRLKPDYFTNSYYALQFLKKLPSTGKPKVVKQKYMEVIDDEFKCFNCKKLGHKAVDCDQPRRKRRRTKKNTILSLFCEKDLRSKQLEENEIIFILDSGSAENVAPVTRE